MLKTKPKTPSKAITSRKDTKLQIRLQPKEKQLIERAARLRQTTVSGFLLAEARTAAEQVLADQKEFALPPDRWAAFCAALDTPPRKLPALKKLLTEASVFDDTPAAQ